MAVANEDAQRFALALKLSPQSHAAIEEAQTLTGWDFGCGPLVATLAPVTECFDALRVAVEALCWSARERSLGLDVWHRVDVSPSIGEPALQWRWRQGAIGNRCSLNGENWSFGVVSVRDRRSPHGADRGVLGQLRE